MGIRRGRWWWWWCVVCVCVREERNVKGSIRQIPEEEGDLLQRTGKGVPKSYGSTQTNYSRAALTFNVVSHRRLLMGTDTAR